MKNYHESTIKIDKLKAIFNSCSDAVLFLDFNLRIIYANIRAKKIFEDIDTQVNLNKIIELNKKLKESLGSDKTLNNFKLKINEIIFMVDTFEEKDDENNNIITIMLLKEEQNCLFEKINKLETENEMYEQIFENSADGMGCMDNKGKVLKLNKAYEQILELKKEDFLGKPANLIVKKGYLPKLVTPLVLRDKKIKTINIETKDKEILITGLPIFNKQGKLIHVVANIRDMTGLIKLQKKIDDYIDYMKINGTYTSELTRFVEKELNIKVVEKSSKMKEVLKRATISSQVDSNVLIYGASGTGKEVIAKVIQRVSPRRDNPFITINCTTIPENLLESELFGYERGAFTGASHSKIGLFELAHNGTLFLDEISSLSLRLQAKLLRVVQEKEFIRVGGKKSVKVNFRLITASNANLYDMVNKGTFREDLYYRLNVINIEIPPLRERKEEIKVLAEYFATYFNKKYNSNLNISPETLKEMQNYDWPGNVRELENVVEKMSVLGQEIFLKDHVNKANITNDIDPLNDGISLPQFIYQTEKKIILQAYRQKGSTRKAAQLLGINQSTFVRKFQKYGFNSKEAIK